MVDNCYCEFVEEKTPLEVGADIMVGSFMKNLGAENIANNQEERNTQKIFQDRKFIFILNTKNSKNIDIVLPLGNNDYLYTKYS